jgi:hypothetical protein
MSVFNLGATREIDGGKYVNQRIPYGAWNPCEGCAFEVQSVCHLKKHHYLTCSAGSHGSWVPHDDEAKAATAARKLRS